MNASYPSRQRVETLWIGTVRSIPADSKMRDLTFQSLENERLVFFVDGPADMEKAAVWPDKDRGKVIAIVSEVAVFGPFSVPVATELC